MATCPCLHPQRSFCRRAIHQCGYERCRRAIQYCDNGLQQAGYSTCRDDGATAILNFKSKLANRCCCRAFLRQNRVSILDFKPRLENRCSKEVKTRAIRAVIPDFKPRLANRCSQKAKTGANRAAILDFKPRLANRCRQKVKTGAIPAAQGVKHCAAAGECRMGRDFGRRSRPWLREREGPAAQRWEGKHRRCAPVRSPCPQADSDAETVQIRRQATKKSQAIRA